MSRAGRSATWRWALPALLAVFAALAGLYSLVTPIFEGPDEIWHFAFANYLANGGGLPVLSIEHPDLWLRNAAHPPLYFLPVAALIAPIDRSDFPGSFHFNLASPSITPGSTSDRPNLLIHGRNEDYPFQQTTLAVHLGRVVSLALGVVTLAGVWAVARQLAPELGDGLALATVAVAAFIPQFVYGSGAINNDALAAAGGTWTLAALLALMHQRRQRWAIVSGLALGITLLAKIGMVAIVPLPVAAVALMNIDLLKKDEGRTTKVEWMPRLKSGAATLVWIYVPAALVAGWWYGRNWVLYGDPLAWQVWQVMAGVGRPTPTLAQFASDMRGLFGTFWADFGLRVDREWAWVFALLTLLALGGWVRRLARRNWAGINVSGLLLASAAFALLLASAVRYSFQITDIHGRLLYPAIAAVAFVLVAGLAGFGPRLGRGLVAVTIGGLCLTTLLVPFLLIQPAYARPVLPVAQLPPGTSPAGAEFGDQVELVGYQLQTPRVSPGRAVHALTYWRTLAGAPNQAGDMRANLAFISPDGKPLGHVETLLGSSVYPSSVWAPGDLVVADLTWTAPAGADRPIVADLWLSVRGQSPDPLPIGSSSSLVLGRVSFAGGAACSPAVRLDADFGGFVRLAGYSLGSGQLTLCWSAERTMATDYTVFVHIVDTSGKLLSTADGPPRHGLYPTSAWQPGEDVADVRSLRVPPGANLQLGLYRLDTGERLSLAGSDATMVVIAP